MSDKKQLAVIGAHVQHSRSPLIHEFWIEKHNIDAEYGYEVIDESENFESRFRELFATQKLSGANITIPYKEKTFQILEKMGADLSESARKLKAVNVVYRNGENLCGANTDGAGFLAALPDEILAVADSVLLLGAGGAARAIIAALAEKQKIKICNRTRARAEQLVQDLGLDNVEIYDWQERYKAAQGCALLVNTSSLTMQGGMGENKADDVDMQKLVAALPDDASVCDIVYAPLNTPLLKAASARRLTTIDGLGMLLHQAALSFEFWFGIKPEVSDELREALIEDLQK